jgi:hypothetical protein
MGKKEKEVTIGELSEWITRVIIAAKNLPFRKRMAVCWTIFKGGK